MRRCDFYRCVECEVVVEEFVVGRLPLGIVCKCCGGLMRRLWGAPGVGRVDGAGGSPSR